MCLTLWLLSSRTRRFPLFALVTVQGSRKAAQDLLRHRFQGCGRSWDSAPTAGSCQWSKRGRPAAGHRGRRSLWPRAVRVGRKGFGHPFPVWQHTARTPAGAASPGCSGLTLLPQGPGWGMTTNTGPSWWTARWPSDKVAHYHPSLSLLPRPERQAAPGRAQNSSLLAAQ